MLDIPPEGYRWVKREKQPEGEEWVEDWGYVLELIPPGEEAKGLIVDLTIDSATIAE